MLKFPDPQQLRNLLGSHFRPCTNLHVNLMVEVTLPIFNQHSNSILQLRETVSLPLLTVHTVLRKSNFRSTDILKVFTVVHKTSNRMLLSKDY